jgi:nitrite reductase (NADH) small subunit
MQWQTVCKVTDLPENTGVCALVNGLQVAIFYLGKQEFIRTAQATQINSPPPQLIYAVGNYDPIGKANVLSRGIVGDINGEIVVASPLYKQHFSLGTGVCLEDATVTIPVYACRIADDSVQVDTRLVAPLRQLVTAE